ncbi:MAG: DUF1579 family protein [Phycisphaerae bacterium]
MSVMMLALGGLAGTACMPTMTIEDLKAMRPERPPELDRLNMFVGHWEGTGEARMAGLDQVLKSTGTSDITWEADRSALLERGDYEMEGLGNMKGLGLWTYDPKARKYRNAWVDSFGGLGTGTCTYNEKTGTWKMRVKSHGPMGTTIGEGTVRFPDENTMSWTWREWDPLHLVKVFDMTGTSKRK